MPAGAPDLRLPTGTTTGPTPAALPEVECADLWSRFLRLSHRVHLSYWTILAASFAARYAPRWFAHAVARAIGTGVFWTWRTQREAITANMRQVLGPTASDRQVRHLARRAYVNYFDYLIDFLRFPYEDQARLEQRVASRGWEHLDAALAGGKGAIMVTLHLGAFDIAGWLLAVRGYRVNAVVESFEPPKLNALIQSRRLSRGVEPIPLENPSAKILRALRRNEILALLIDRPTPDGVPVRFCGGTVRIPAGTATLALKTGAPILAAYVVRRPDHSLYGEIEPAVQFEPTGQLDADVAALTQRVMDDLERIVRRHPDQWYMFRRFWLPGEVAGR